MTFSLLNSAALWITLQPAQLELKAREQRNLRYKMSVPRERHQGQMEASSFDTLGIRQSGEAVYTLGRIRGSIGEIEVAIEALVECGDAKD